MMKTALNKLLRSEKGYALPIVLILLLIGGLILGPLLSFMSTGVMAGQVFEEKMYGLYAADAGVEDALWNLMFGGLIVPEGGASNLTGFTIDNHSVNVTIEDEGASVYKITATATSDDGSITTIETYVSNLNFSWLLDNAITSGNNITFQPGSSATGTVVDYYNGDSWPTADQFSDYFWDDVKNETPFLEGVADAKIFIQDTPWSTDGIGPLYREGRLNIKNTGSHDLEVGLSGTVYVTGDLDVGAEGNRFVLHLNGQTLFAQGGIDIGNKVTIEGSGVIIAVGDVKLDATVTGDPNNFVFVISIEGTTWFNPNGEFYGSVAGDTEVQLQSNTSITWTDPSGVDLNFPTSSSTFEIETWQIE